VESDNKRFGGASAIVPQAHTELKSDNCMQNAPTVVRQLSKPQQMTSSVVQTLLWDLSVCLTKFVITQQLANIMVLKSTILWSVQFGALLCSLVERQACNNQFLAMQHLAKHSAM